MIPDTKDFKKLGDWLAAETGKRAGEALADLLREREDFRGRIAAHIVEREDLMKQVTALEAALRGGKIAQQEG